MSRSINSGSHDDRTQEYSGECASFADSETIHVQATHKTVRPELGLRLQEALGSQFQVGEILGRGGMGVVFKAVDMRLNRDVAIKVLLPELGTSPPLRARLVREAQTAAKLFHPHIIPVHAVGESDDLSWFVMSYIQGTSLRELIERDGALPPASAIVILQGVALALAYGHAHGVIHRDVKPDNIMIEQWTGRPLLTDFGIAHVDDDMMLTSPGQVLGTASYMAPEQALGQAVTEVADLYSLALVGCFMLIGADPIKVKSLPELVTRHVKQERVDLSAVRIKAPVPLVNALERCLEPAPSRRFAKMEELLAVLQESLPNRPETPPPVREVIRESERLTVLLGMGAMVTGMIGISRTQFTFPLVLLWLAVSNWIGALDWADKSGIGWPQVRLALDSEATVSAYATQARGRRWRRPRALIFWSITMLAGGSMGLFLQDNTVGVLNNGWDMLLMLTGGGLLAAVIRIPRQHGMIRTARAAVRFMAVVAILAGAARTMGPRGSAILAAVREHTTSDPGLIWALGDPVLALVGLLVFCATFARKDGRLGSRWRRLSDRLGMLLLSGRR